MATAEIRIYDASDKKRALLLGRAVVTFRGGLLHNCQVSDVLIWGEIREGEGEQVRSPTLTGLTESGTLGRVIVQAYREHAYGPFAVDLETGERCDAEGRAARFFGLQQSAPAAGVSA